MVIGRPPRDAVECSESQRLPMIQASSWYFASCVDHSMNSCRPSPSVAWWQAIMRLSQSPCSLKSSGSSCSRVSASISGVSSPRPAASPCARVGRRMRRSSVSGTCGASSGNGARSFQR